jgi:hypothetical protein
MALMAWICTGSSLIANEPRAGPAPPSCLVDGPAISRASDRNTAPGLEPGSNSALIEELVQWIGNNTPYEVSTTLKHPPAISLCQTGETILYEGDEIVVDEHLRAAYDAKDRRIYLVSPWEASDINDQSRLLHELIHEVQLLNRNWRCLQEPEWEAYKLQAKWLEEHGGNAAFDWLYIFFASKCPSDVHP